MTLYSCVFSSSSSSLSSPSPQFPLVRKMTSLPCNELFGMTYSDIDEKSKSDRSGRSTGVWGRGAGTNVGVVSLVAAGEGSDRGEAVRFGPLTVEDARGLVRVRDTDRDRETEGDRRPSGSDAEDDISRSGTW